MCSYTILGLRPIENLKARKELVIRFGDPLWSPCDGADSTRTFIRQQSRVSPCARPRGCFPILNLTPIDHSFFHLYLAIGSSSLFCSYSVALPLKPSRENISIRKKVRPAPKIADPTVISVVRTNVSSTNTNRARITKTAKITASPTKTAATETTFAVSFDICNSFPNMVNPQNMLNSFA
jgi:hypothetical protein